MKEIVVDTLAQLFMVLGVKPIKQKYPGDDLVTLHWISWLMGAFEFNPGKHFLERVRIKKTRLRSCRSYRAGRFYGHCHHLSDDD